MSRLDSVYAHWIRVARTAAGDVDRCWRAGNDVGARIANGRYRQACRAARAAGDLRRGALPS